MSNTMIVDFFVALWNAPEAIGLGFFSALTVVAVFRFAILSNDWKSLWLGVATGFLAACIYNAIALTWLAVFGDFVEVMAKGGWEQLVQPLKANAFGAAIAAIIHVLHKAFYD